VCQVRGSLLTFHRVAPTHLWLTRPNRDFYIDAVFLDFLLGALRRAGWDIVTMTEAALRMRDPARGRRFVNISIDDAYRDTAELAVPIFRLHQAPVTVYVTTGIPDATITMWTAGLETVITDRDQITVPNGQRASSICARNSAEKRALYARLAASWELAGAERQYVTFCRLNGVDPATLHERHAATWAMLKQLARDPCVEIGAHTVSHPRLSTLGDASCEAEITMSRQRLEHELGIAVDHFAYPFGRARDCGAREFAFAQRAGFSTSSTTRKGVIRSGKACDVHALPRNTLNGSHRHLAHVRMHLSGLSGIGTTLLGGG
jgi:peptidoglycan/xylan/chitin deacetylase (PgdA/CDA1 family)